MNPFFANVKAPDPSLLELKFRELILTIAGDPANEEMLAFFHALLQQPQTLLLRDIMEANFCFNLKLDEFARLCNRSLSGFKRDFESVYGMPPGRWLLARRLEHAMHFCPTLAVVLVMLPIKAALRIPRISVVVFAGILGSHPIARER